MNSIQLSIFSSKISAIADEMGAVLQRSGFSPNIRDRLDYSCAVFNTNAELCAQAAHIPVHLGSMAFAMHSVVDMFDWTPGDAVIFNDPYLGGTHLPDVTLLSPVFVDDALVGFVANRAHHANIGADSPGSMPVSSSLEEEGIVIPPTLLARRGEIIRSVWDQLFLGMGSPDDSLSETSGDIRAQLSANQKGLLRLQTLVEEMGIAAYNSALDQLNQYAESLSKTAIEEITNGTYSAKDYMDDDGQGNRDIGLCVKLVVKDSTLSFDFAGSSEQVNGNINCPLSVTAAGVFYVVRCLLPIHTPACAGVFRSVSINAPMGSLLNAKRPAAVAAGNVETSSRVVDLVIKALAQAIPERMPADSQGTMNNLAMGYITSFEHSDSAESSWSYYETIAGGCGAHQSANGLSATHSHMTNTLNTPVEVLETNFPLRLAEYSIRRNSGGSGHLAGGDGLVREYEFLNNTSVSLLTERRYHAPKGAQGGSDASPGCNLLDGTAVSPKSEFQVKKGSRLRIETPGGGGFGDPKTLAENLKQD